METQEQERRFRKGQRVKIITCPLENPKHAGQVGTIITYQPHTRMVRVHVGMGICRALESGVEPADEEAPEVPLKKPYHYEWNSLNTRYLQRCS